MAPLSDPLVLASIRGALKEWRVTGYVTWKEVAREWVRKNLQGVNPESIAGLMHDSVAAGGTIDQVREQRPEWNDREYHYDFRLQISGRVIYIESILQDDDPSDPTINIVSIHDA